MWVPFAPPSLHSLQEPSALEHSSLTSILGEGNRKNPQRSSAEKLRGGHSDHLIKRLGRLCSIHKPCSSKRVRPRVPAPFSHSHNHSHQRAEFPQRVISLPPLPCQEWYLYACSYCILCQWEESFKMQRLCHFHSSVEKINDLVNDAGIIWKRGHKRSILVNSIPSAVAPMETCLWLTSVWARLHLSRRSEGCIIECTCIT